MKQVTIQRQQDNATIAHCVGLANTYFSRLAGLMGKPGLPQGHGLWITPCNSVHSCFMRFLFDAVFVNAQGQVVHMVQSMPPWQATPLIKGAKAVLELPEGTIALHQLQVGDTLCVV
jgi:uncharacterized protein